MKTAQLEPSHPCPAAYSDAGIPSRFVNARIATSGDTIDSGQLHVRLDRTIGDGLHEDYDLVNYSRAAVELDLEMRMGDYADLFDVKEPRLVCRGSLESRNEPS